MLSDEDGRYAILAILSTIAEAIVGAVGLALSTNKEDQDRSIPNGKSSRIDIDSSNLLFEMVALCIASLKISHAKQKRKGDGKIYTVYALGEENTDIVKYVGRVKTKNYNARMEYHRMTKNYVPLAYKNGLTYEEARGLEEYYMNYFHTLTGKKPQNVIHGISPYNPNFGLYMNDAFSYLENKIEDTFLNLMDGGFSE